LNLKIAIYTISKNEVGHVSRWCASNLDADLRVVCDTGSTDGTRKALEADSVTVVPITIVPWRFDDARNTALNLLPSDIDVCIWQDLDEILLPGWRSELEANWIPDATTANHRYRHNGGAWQWHSKIHARHGCIWQGAVHETLKWQQTPKEIWIDKLFLDEQQDVFKSRNSYLPLLLKKVSEGDGHWRTLYFLANEYQNQGDMPNCIKARIQSFHACSDGDVTASYIARNIARDYTMTCDHKQARSWFSRSVSLSDERENWYAYAKFLEAQQQWDQCYVAARSCLAVAQKRDGFTYESMAWSHDVYDLAARAAYNLGVWSQAREYGEQALALAPGDDRLKKNLDFYLEKANDAR
jgi:glycosyltransferase involved in cell wall biosynthesis